MFEGPGAVEEAGEKLGAWGGTDALAEIEKGAGVGGGVEARRTALSQTSSRARRRSRLSRWTIGWNQRACADEALEDADGVVVAGGVDALVDQDFAELIGGDFIE